VFHQFLQSIVEKFVSLELDTVFRAVSYIISTHTEKDKEEKEKTKEPTDFHTAVR
jgi:hypothetical protein